MFTVLASSNGSSVANIVSTAVAAFGVVLGVLVTIVFSGAGRPSSEDERRRETLDGRLDRLARSIRESARLAEQVSAEVDVRAAAVRELEEKAREAEALAAAERGSG